MKIQIMRVMGVRSHLPGVLAIVDGFRVRWDRGPGWSCTCPIDANTCPHVDAVAALLSPRVTTRNTEDKQLGRPAQQRKRG